MSFVCGTCDKIFMFQFELIVHRYSHRVNFTDYSERRVKCELCDVECVNVEHLKNHVNQHIQIQKFKCDTCGKDFVYENRYLHHILKHMTTIKDCVFCDKTFTSVRNLENHIRVHTRETPYKCGKCSKIFVREDHLTVQERTHAKKTKKTKENSTTQKITPKKMFFNCNICPKQYSRKEHLQMHVRSHTDNLVHLCDFCGQKFWRADHLKRHESIHNYDAITKQCSCIVCGERLLKDRLKAHVIEHHSDKMQFKCNKCEKSFPKKGNLTFHDRSHHYQPADGNRK